MRHTYKIIFLFICLMFFGCARIVTPKGGEKDIAAPMFVSSSPKMNATNFNGNKIEIYFDEYIVLDNASGKLIVSPPLKHKPTIGSKLKTLYIKDLDSLQENTTYIFDFGDAITDFTEGNRLNHFAFAFSTGKDIDSLIYNGRIINAFNLKPEADKYVALYNTNNKDYIRKNIPNYITKCDSVGRFYFRNIKNGNYTLVAFTDLNQNMIYDLPTESFGIKENIQPIIDTIQENKASILQDTILFTEIKDTILKILSTKQLNEREIQIITSNSVSDSFAIHFNKPALDSTNYTIYKNISADTITIFAIGKTIFDTCEFIITDKNNFTEKENLVYRTKNKKNNEERLFKLDVVQTNLPYFENLQLRMPFIVSSNQLPLKAKLFTQTDTLNIDFIQSKDNPKLLCVNKLLKESEKYQLFIEKDAIENLRGERNDSLRVDIMIDNQDEYGTLIINISDSLNSMNNVILTLFDDKGERVSNDILTKISNKQIEFQNLKEGKYRLRLIDDRNNNGVWDGGEFNNNITPEKVIYFPKQISIRKGWQSQEDWIIKQ